MTDPFRYVPVALQAMRYAVEHGECDRARAILAGNALPDGSPGVCAWCDLATEVARNDAAECVPCRGSGVVADVEGSAMECPRCDGEGATS